MPTEPEGKNLQNRKRRVSPQLSPEEKSRAQYADTDADMKAAQQALEAAVHHTLNATQQDMADVKINSFLTQAREAVELADWLRAKNLAQKAHVLSNVIGSVVLVLGKNAPANLSSPHAPRSADSQSKTANMNFSRNVSAQRK